MQLDKFLSMQKARKTSKKLKAYEINWLVNRLFVRREFKPCLDIIEKQIRMCDGAKGSCEYALYVKGLILRNQGKIEDSLQLFRLTTTINPQNIQNIKQVARSLYLLGKKQAALDIYNDALTIDDNDWEVYHNQGLCHKHLKDYAKAIRAFQAANNVQPHVSSFMQLGEIFVKQENYDEAVEIYEEALEHSPQNPNLLTTLGLLFLRIGENYKAFKNLRMALSVEPQNVKVILAFGSIIQDHNNMNDALKKYRVAAVKTPMSAQLWNNIGMCFFGKGKYMASISCLKRALYLDSFEWIIAYNLGLVHLCTKQYASAFHFLSASINLKPNFPPSYMYLGIILAKLDDFDNACSAYRRAIEMETDHLFHLNYAITLYNHDKNQEALKHFTIAKELFGGLDDDSKNADADVVSKMDLLGRVLGQQG